MTNNLLMLVKLDADTIAFLSLIVSIVGAVAAIVAAFYSRKAATKDDLARVEQNTDYVEHFSNKILSIDTSTHPQEKQEGSHTQQDPSQPQAERKIPPAQHKASEAQTQQEVSPPEVERKASQVQAQQEASQPQPQRIPISVEGEAMGEVPLELSLTVQDSSVRISRVETLSEAGNILGSSSCKATQNALVFKSFLAPEKLSQWWDGGASTSEGEARSVLRVYLRLADSRSEVFRDMPVSIVRGLRNVGIATLIVWTIKGTI